MNEKQLDSTRTFEKLDFEEPGEPMGNSSAKYRFVEALKKNPGRWAVYRRDAKAPMGGTAKMTYPGTEWASRMNAQGRWSIYGRFVGEAK